MNSLRLALAVLAGTLLATAARAQQTQLRGHVPAHAPAVHRPAPVHRAAPAPAFAPARVGSAPAPRRGGGVGGVGGFAPTAVGPVMNFGGSPGFVGRGRPANFGTFSGGPTSAPGDPVARRRLGAGAADGFAINPVGNLALIAAAQMGGVPDRPRSINRPWAGAYPWYHGGWNGWSAWPGYWADDGAPADVPRPAEEAYANPYVVIVHVAAPQARRRMSFSREIGRAHV